MMEGCECCSGTARDRASMFYLRLEFRMRRRFRSYMKQGSFVDNAVQRSGFTDVVVPNYPRLEKDIDECSGLSGSISIGLATM